MNARRIAWSIVGLLSLCAAVRAQTGACCNPVQGICQNIPCEQCGAEYGCYPGITCAQLNPPCTAITGACCDRRAGTCYDWWQAFYCSAPFFEQFVGKYCWEMDCPIAGIVYVDANAVASAEDGTTWCSAFRSLHEALNFARGGDTVRVADGVYKPDPTGLADPHEATFRMKSGVTIEGGYAGCGANDPDERRIDSFPTILSGDLNGDDAKGFVNYSDNVYQIVRAVDVDSTGVLDGFVVTGGSATGKPGFFSYGGGVYVLRGEPVVQNCQFVGNNAFSGGALGVNSSDSAIRGCLIHGNSAYFGGGIRANGPGRVIIDNSTIVANTAVVLGGGIAAARGVQLILTNSILWGNTDSGAADEPAQLLPVEESVVTIHYCDLQGWTGSLGGIGNIGDDPLFIDPLGADGLAGTPDDNFRLAADSPCVNAGDPSLTFDPAEVDLDGHARVLCVRVDMGAYESGIGDSDCNATINLRDFAALQNCFASNGAPYSAECEAFDFEGDGDVDLRDYAAFFELLTSSGSP